MIRILRQLAVIKKKKNLKNNYCSIICGPIRQVAKYRPGHFIHVKIPSSDLFFRRAMSVAAVDLETSSIEFIFKAMGRGTRLMIGLKRGDTLDIVGPLGNSFSLPRKNQTVIMVAGGIGFPPPLYLTTELVKRGHDPAKIHFCYGGRSSSDIIERNRIKKLGVNFHPTTDDGSFGAKGLVTNTVESLIQSGDSSRLQLYACGPEPMLKAVDQLALKYGVAGELSLEAPMPCGVGICLGCVVRLTAGGHARVCADGPVFQVGQVVL